LGSVGVALDELMGSGSIYGGRGVDKQSSCLSLSCCEAMGTMAKTLGSSRALNYQFTRDSADPVSGAG
jgi:hypothetical protein